MPGPHAPILPNKKPAKERIMIYGGPGIGKTHQFFQIAKWHHQLGSNAKFYGISTDQAFEVLWMNDELPNVEWTDVATMEEAMQAIRNYHNKAKPGDWLCVDLIDDIWKMAQDEYAAKQGKQTNAKVKDLGDLWNVDPGSNYPIEGWEWGQPNARYRAFANNYMLRSPAHVMVISGAQPLMGESKSGSSGESKLNVDTFGHIGFKPKGQKDQGHQFHTALYLESGGRHKQKWATAKERWGKREHVGQEMKNGQYRTVPFDDFFLDYLVGVAGWSMGDDE